MQGFVGPCFNSPSGHPPFTSRSVLKNWQYAGVCGDNQGPGELICSGTTGALTAGGAIQGGFANAGSLLDKTRGSLILSMDGLPKTSQVRINGNATLRTLNKANWLAEASDSMWVKSGGRFLLGAGAALSFTSEYDTSRDNGNGVGNSVVRASAAGVADTATSWGMAEGGMVTGAAIGSFIAPGVGTVVGGVVGGIVGAAASIPVDNVINNIINWF